LPYNNGGKIVARSIASHFQNFSKNLTDVLVVLLRGDAEGVDDGEQQIGVRADEVVINRLLGSGAAGLARKRNLICSSSRDLSH
jgi:hypothetical protein